MIEGGRGRRPIAGGGRGARPMIGWVAQIPPDFRMRRFEFINSSSSRSHYTLTSEVEKIQSTTSTYGFIYFPTALFLTFAL